MAIRARFIGPKNDAGEPLAYLHGVPARDLNDEDWHVLSAEQRTDVRACGLYDVKAAEKSPAKEGG